MIKLYEQAKRILEHDLIIPAEIHAKIQLNYEDVTQVAPLPAQPILEWCKDFGYMVIAAPPHRMDSGEVFSRWPEFLTIAEVRAFKKGTSHLNTCTALSPRWIYIEKLKGRPMQKMDFRERQRRLVTSAGLQLYPSALEVFWCTVVLLKVRGDIQPSWILGAEVQTSSLSNRGFPVVAKLRRGLSFHEKR